MEMKKEYTDAKNFWNQTLLLDDETKQAIDSSDKETEWKDIGIPKLFDASQTLTSRKKVLDYGCGAGSLALAIAKGGCLDVTAVDVAKNAADFTQYMVDAYGVSNSIKVLHIEDTWLAEHEGNTYDGIICSNVVDVLPPEVSLDIIKNLARVATKDGSVIISMNFYREPKSNPDRGIEIRNGNCMFVNDILRLVLRTDEEWTEIFKDYFEVEKIVHFGWPGEETEDRRIFFLKKK